MRAKVAAIGLLALVVIGVSCAPTDSTPPPASAEVALFESEPIQPQGDSWHKRRVSVNSEEEARHKLAFESLVGRMPKGNPISPAEPLSEESKRRWEIFDSNTARFQGHRVELLKALHEKTRQFFVAGPGFGPDRWTPTFSPEQELMDETVEYSAGADYQPGERAVFPTSLGEPLTRVEPREEFHHYHDGGMRDFFNPASFGYVKDREHVSGFKSHGFRSIGEYVNLPLRVQYVQLVGILTQPEPVVYLTDKLPSMEQVRQGKTRKLDLFETAGLAELRKGGDLFIAKKGEAVRMLGALRATKVCLQCHDAKEGDKLGAFSYTLRPDR